jgi:large subunit ribosomal protein L1
MGKTKTAFVGETLVEKQDGTKKVKTKKTKKEEPKKVHIAGLKGGQRIKTVEAELPPEAGEAEAEIKKEKKAPKQRGKKYLQAKAKIDHASHYKVADAIKHVKATSYSQFDGTVELHLVLKKIGVSANVTLPHFSGKEKKVEVANETTINKLADGKIDFDILLATPEMMPKLVPFARLLGPKGLMPNPKNGTLITDVKKAKNFSAKSLRLKTEKEAPLIHTVVGKISQPDKELIENTEAIISALGPKQIVKAYAKATMGPSIKIQI